MIFSKNRISDRLNSEKNNIQGTKLRVVLNLIILEKRYYFGRDISIDKSDITTVTMLRCTDKASLRYNKLMLKRVVH